jgi:radical SAM protein with 4Fe4S-binding SPASM domain
MAVTEPSLTYLEHIGWVDEYVKQIRPYIFVRETDCLLIKIPNEAYRLNSMGIRILKHLNKGGRVHAIVNQYEDSEKVARDIHHFFCDLKLILKGCYHERGEYMGIEKVAFGLRFSVLPVLSEVAITYRCNLSCRFCYAGCGCRKAERSSEMSSREVRTILNRIRNEAEVPSVSFTGGEPMLRKDIIPLIRHAKTLSMWTNLITNGTLIDEKQAETLKGAGLDSAQVSLEAGTPDLHDKIVRHAGAFRKTMSGILALRKAGIRVHTNTTVCGLNRDHLTGVLDAVQKMGLTKLSMNLLMPAGSSLNDLNSLIVRYSEIGPIVLDTRDKAMSMGLEFMWYSPTPICLFNPVIHGLGNKGCAACDGLLSVAPNGDILPCSSYPEPVGNLLRDQRHFTELWANPSVRYFQEKHFAHDLCRRCEHLAVCQGGCPLYWRHVGYQEILEENHVLVSGS